MSELTTGSKIPDFDVMVTGRDTLTQDDLNAQYTIVYFYPKDNTPGCTTEGQDFRDAYEQFKALNCEIYGVSKDSIKVHSNFKAKHDFPFELISDPDEVFCKLFDVIKLKKMYGKEYMGIDRSTFLIGPDLTLLAQWRKVKVKGHVAEVLEKLKEFAS